MENVKLVVISSNTMLDELSHSILEGEKFASSFEFSSDDYFDKLLDSIGVSTEKFKEKYWFYDETKNLHVSQSSEDFVWISTIGLVSSSKPSENSFINAFEAQSFTLASLIESTDELLKADTVFDIDSFNYSELSRITPALFHNIVFFFELFGKAYLSICQQPNKSIHTLGEIFDLVCNTMFALGHNNSEYHAIVLPMFKSFVEYIASIPAGFKEQNIKYDWNTMDNTVISVSRRSLSELRNTISLCRDFLLDFHHDPVNCSKIKQGYYNKLQETAKTPDQVSFVESKYAFLLLSKYSVNSASESQLP